MVPNVASQGQSFKGAFAYYLHDKGQDSEGRRLDTSERVEWTATRNLATDNPHTAKRIMIATAQGADELKAAAGIKTTGRKSKHGPVYSYSLSWAAEEAGTITRADMLKAADDTLKLLKADHLQAVIIAHNDTPHPHVHVVVNRVDPKTGKLATFSQDWTRLDRWAAEYERSRGLIVTPRRQDKDEARAAEPDADKRRAYIKNRLAEQQRSQSEAAALKARGDAQKIEHRQQWTKLAADQKARRKGIYEAADGRIKERLQFAREEYRPLWADLYRRQKDERRAYDARERYLTGKVQNAIDAVRSRQIRGDGSDRGFLTMAFGYLASRDARRAEFDGRQTAARDSLAAQAKAHNAAAIATVKAERTQSLSADRAKAGAEADALKAAQADAARKNREAWKAIYEARQHTHPKREREPREYRPRSRPERQAAAERAGTVSPTKQQTHKTAEQDARAAWSKGSTRRTDEARQIAAPEAKPAPQERPTMPTMKDEFDWKRGQPQQPPRPIPNKTVSLSQPWPAPSPAGEVPSVNRKPAPVPVIDKDAAFKQAGQVKPPPAPQRDFRVTVRPKQQAPERPQAPQQPARPAFDWKAAARPQQAPERPQAPPQDRSKPIPPPPVQRQPERPQAPQHDRSKPTPPPPVQRQPERPQAPQHDRSRPTPPPPVQRQPERSQQPAAFDWSRTQQPKPPPQQKAQERPRQPEPDRGKPTPPPPAQRPQEPSRQAERQPDPAPSARPAFDWNKAAAPAPNPAPERQAEPTRFDWGKAAEPTRETTRDQFNRRDRNRDYDPER